MTNSGPLDGQQARALLERAGELAQAGEFEGASALYSRLVGNADPIVHVAALLGLADARYRLDDEEGALQAWIVATQAPENPLTWRAWVALAGARVRQGDLGGAARCYRQAERRAPTEERGQIASRLGWLNKEMGNTWTARRYFGRARSGVFTPVVTYAILAVTVGIGLLTIFTPRTEELVALLMLDKQRVLAGEYWRLLTVTLVHGGLLHLAFNMYALYIVGPLVEVMYGRVLFALVYLLTAAVGSVASYMVFPTSSVGASGAVFGLFGLLAVANFVHKPVLGRQARALSGQIVFLIVINVAIGFTFPRIDNAAHLGGLAGGAFLGLTVVPRGVATLSSLWQGVPDGGAAAGGRGRGMLQLGAMAALALLVAVLLSVPPLWAAQTR
ncbi:MAG: rhomboid family intramembrane serine protease [Chloroflexota bacterium]|nr:rhomboid family intramembrane serine protease [Chloroflexota bacterium]